MFSHKLSFIALMTSVVLITAFLTTSLSSRAAPGPGSLVKGSLSAVYYLSEDGGRYSFPNEKIYFSWYNDFDAVQQISDTELASYILKGNVTYRPGVRLIKIESDPSVYVVDNGAKLRWIPNEAVAIEKFGSSWAKQVDDVPVSFFIDYQIVEALAATEGAGANYSPSDAQAISPVIQKEIDFRKNRNQEQANNTNESDPFLGGGGSGGSGGSSGSQNNTPAPNPAPTQTCGNGIREGLEQCDGSDLNGESCSSNGFSSGSLSCNASCVFVTNACSNDAPAEEEGPDTTVPSVSWTAPSAGATVSGSLSMTASASDNVGVSSVKFQINNTLITTDTSSPYSTSYDTTGIANGSYTLYAVAKDAVGNHATSTRSITVNNVVADVTAPSVSFTAPSAGATVSGSVTITATASDNAGVASVVFKIGSTTIATDTSAPYSTTYNSASTVNGSYTLTAIAADASGNTATATRSITVSNSASSGITPIINASRLSGPAPLAVFFGGASTTCATCTGDKYAFHDLAYSWNYGDPSSGNWVIDGRSKNRDLVPLGAHVFETPGTYTVALAVHDPALGQTTSASVQVTVTNPDTVWSGTNTTCVSTSGNFTGCPSGANQVTTTNVDDVLNSCLDTSGKRCLFRRGETFTMLEDAVVKGQNTLVGAYGSGAKPHLNSSGRSSGRVFGGATGSERYVIMDLQLTGPSGSQSRLFETTSLQKHGMLFRLSAVTSTFNFPIGLGADKKESQHFFLVENEIAGIFGGSKGGNMVYLRGWDGAIMGNRIEDSINGEHVIRIPQAERFLISHNLLGGAENTKAILTLRSYDKNDPDPEIASRFTRNVVVYANTFLTNSGRSSFCGAPDGTTLVRCDDILIDSNFVTAGIQYSYFNPIYVFGIGTDDQATVNRLTMRNTICDLSSFPTDGGDCITEGASINDRFHVYNNSCYGGNRPFACVVMNEVPNSILANNLAYGTNNSVNVHEGSFSSGTNNYDYCPSGCDGAAVPFTSASPNSTVANYQLSSGLSTAPLNAGTAVPIYYDFGGRVRPAGAGYDVGAWERDASMD